MESARPLAMSFEGQAIKGYHWKPAQQARGKLLILHGYGSRIASFEPIIGIGRKHGYEVFGFDAPGHGSSAGKQINANSYRNLINEIRRNFGPFDAYVAHSLGGLALVLSLETFSTAEKPKVALVCPATEGSTAARLFLDFMTLPQPVRNSFYKEIELLAGVSINWYSISRAITTVKADFLWIHEKTDEVTPFADVEPVMQKDLPNIRFYLTEGYRHNGIYRENEVKKQVEAFLQN